MGYSISGEVSARLHLIDTTRSSSLRLHGRTRSDLVHEYRANAKMDAKRPNHYYFTLILK